MSSLRRVNSSRANGSRSRGPATPEGKQRSARNAIRHGLLAKCLVIGEESPENFQDLIDEHLAHFGPLDGVEFGMVEEMTAAYWRMRRIWAIEKEWMESDLPNQESEDAITKIAGTFATLADSNKYKVLQRYENRMHRMYQRSLRSLLLLQTKNDQTNPVPIPDTKSF